MRKLIAALKLIRLHNVVMAGVGVWIGGYLTGSMEGTKIVLAAMAAAFVCAGGNALNDYLDIEGDRINHPMRPLPKGDLPIYAALLMTIVSWLGALIAGIVSGIYILLSVLGAIAILALYEFRLKRSPLAGNLAVAFLGGATFIVGGLAVSPDKILALPGSLVPAAFAFLMHLIREIIKDRADYAGDAATHTGKHSGFILSGKIKILVAGLAAILIGLTVIPIVQGWYRPVFNISVIFLIDLPLALIAAAFMFLQDIKRYKLMTSTIKVLMILGLLAFFLGKR